MTAQHVDYMDLFFHQFFCPAFQCGTVGTLQCIDDQTRQEEIIGHVTLFCNLLVVLLAVACMDLRKQSQVILVCQFADFFQQFPGSRLIQEVFLTRLLRRIGKCIQTDDLCAVSCQCFQSIVIELPYQRGFDVQIHLSQVFSLALQQFHNALLTAVIDGEFCRFLTCCDLFVDFLCDQICLIILHVGYLHDILCIQDRIFDFLIEGIPVRYIFPIRETYHQNRKTRFAEEHMLDQLLIRLDVAFLCHGSLTVPEFVPVNEEITIFGIVTIFQNILKLAG